jgi:pilus assembly protein Flp/PilA
MQSWLYRQRGQGLVEYGLIIFLIAIVVIAIVTLLGGQIANLYSEINADVPLS